MIFSCSYNFTVVYEKNIRSIRLTKARKRQKFVCIRGIESRLRQIKRRIREKFAPYVENVNTLRRNCETLRRNV